MSQIQTVFQLNYGKYFDQPPVPREAAPTVSDEHNIFNFSRQVRSSNKTGTSKVPVAIDTNGEEQHKEEKLVKNIVKKNSNPNQFEQADQTGLSTDVIASNMPIESVIPEDMAGGSLDTNQVGGSLCDPKEVVENLKEVAKEEKDSESLGAGNGGALAFNSAQLANLGKGDNIKGAGPLTTAAVTSLIAAAPEIIKAIGNLRKANTEQAAGKIGRYTKKCVGGAYDTYKLNELSPEKLDELERLMKQVRSQKRYLSADGMIGSGKFGTFMANAWNRLKNVYNSEQFAPIRNALMNAASNTAQKYINKTADKLASKTQNEDLKNIISTTRDVATDMKNSVINSAQTQPRSVSSNTSGLTDAAGSLFATGGSLSVSKQEINEDADDYDLMSAGIKLYDDVEVENPVETTPNTKSVNRKLYHGSRFSISATRCGRLNRYETKRLSL